LLDVPHAGQRARPGVGARVPLGQALARRDHLRARVAGQGAPAQGRHRDVQAALLRLPRLLAEPAGHLLLAGGPHALRAQRLPSAGPGRALPRDVSAARPLRIGCSGWNYADWRERVYPKGMPARQWLAHYATLFDTVEVNNTFYRLAKPEAVAGWVR